MTTRLGATVSATDTQWAVDNDDILGSLGYPIRLVIESETIEVVGAAYRAFHDTERKLWTVRRGVDGTAPAAHTGGVEITTGAVTTGSDAAALAAHEADTTNVHGIADTSALGGGATLLGPYRVTFETPFIGLQGGTQGAAVGAIPAGAFILRLFAIPVTAWATPTSDPKLQLGTGVPFATPHDGFWAPNAIAFESVEVDLDAAGVNDQPVEYEPDQNFGTPQITKMKAGVAGQILVAVTDQNDGSAPTAGSCDVYALVLTP